MVFTDHMPLIIGLEKGWFKEESLDIEMIELKEHFDALDEIENGTMDITITKPIHLVQDRANDQNMIGFARYLHTNGGIMYNKDKDFTRPKDLIGKRLQYPGAPDPGGIAIAKTMIEADAATLIFENFEILEAKSQGLNVDYFPLKNYNVPDFCQLIFITTPEKLAANESKLKRLIKVIQKAIHYINHHLENAIEIYSTYTRTNVTNQLDKDIIKATAQ